MPLNHNNPVDLKKKVLFTIWILAKPESYLAAGDRFNLAKSTAHGIVKEITNVLTNILPNYVSWPDARMCQEISMVSFASMCFTHACARTHANLYFNI